MLSVLPFLPLWQNRCCDQRLSAVYVGAVHHVDSVIASHCCLRWPRLSTANFTGCCHSHYVTSNRCYLISTRSRSVNESSSSLAAASSDQWQPQNRMPPILPVWQRITSTDWFIAISIRVYICSTKNQGLLSPYEQQLMQPCSRHNEFSRKLLEPADELLLWHLDISIISSWSRCWCYKNTPILNDWWKIYAYALKKYKLAHILHITELTSYFYNARLELDLRQGFNTEFSLGAREILCK